MVLMFLPTWTPSSGDAVVAIFDRCTPRLNSVLREYRQIPVRTLSWGRRAATKSVVMMLFEVEEVYYMSAARFRLGSQAKSYARLTDQHFLNFDGTYPSTCLLPMSLGMPARSRSILFFTLHRVLTVITGIQSPKDYQRKQCSHFLRCALCGLCGHCVV